MKSTDLRWVSFLLGIAGMITAVSLGRAAIDGEMLVIIPAVIFAMMTVICGILFIAATKAYGQITQRLRPEPRAEKDAEFAKNRRKLQGVLIAFVGLETILISAEFIVVIKSLEGNNIPMELLAALICICGIAIILNGVKKFIR